MRHPADFDGVLQAISLAGPMSLSTRQCCRQPHIVKRMLVTRGLRSGSRNYHFALFQRRDNDDLAAVVIMNLSSTPDRLAIRANGRAPHVLARCFILILRLLRVGGTTGKAVDPTRYLRALFRTLAAGGGAVNLYVARDGLA